MCSALSLRKQVSTCFAEQSQRLLLGRLKSDFHEVIHFFTAQTGVFRARALHKHEKRVLFQTGSSQRSLSGNYFGEVGAQARSENMVEKLVGSAEHQLSCRRIWAAIHHGGHAGAHNHASVPVLSPTSSLLRHILKQQGGGRKLLMAPVS